MLDGILADLRFTIAAARRSRGFVATAVLTLALGIGVTTAVLSAAYGVLLAPLPYPDSERIVQLWEIHPGAPAPPGEPPLANTTFRAWRPRLRALDRIGLFGARDFTVAFPDEAVRVHGGELSPAIFDILGVVPQAGRLFVPADDVPGHHDFVVLSDRLWHDRFGAEPGAVGRTITVDGRPHLVVGVAPAGFAFPDPEALMWTPFDDPTILTPSVQGGMWLGGALGRLAPGASIRDVEAEGTAVARSIPRPPVADLLFGAGGPVEVEAATLISRTTERVRPAMLVLVAGVGLVLLVGCANVANLLLARGLARERELVLRKALGADRGRLARQLFLESAVLAAAGGAGGLGICLLVLGAGRRLAGAIVPRLAAVEVDATAMLVALGLAMAVAVLSGTLPAVRGASVDLAGALRGADGATAGGMRSRRARVLRDALVAGETALAAMLLVGAALLGRSFQALLAVDPGYTASGVLSVRTFPPENAPAERVGQFLDGLLARLRADGRVTAAGAGNMMPFNDSTTVTGFDIPAAVGNGRDVRARVVYYVITPGYAEALGLRLRAGRLLAAGDAGAAVPKTLVNEAFVRQYLSPDRVIGLQLPPSRPGQTPTEIVGVVGTQFKDGNDRPTLPEMYVVAGPAPRMSGEVDLLIRTAGDPASLAADVRRLAREVDATMVVGDMVPLERRLGDSLRQPRFAALTLAVFAAVALALAGVGVHGVLSYAVSQRARELAVRSALGAGRASLLGLVVREGVVMTFAGLGLGLVLAAGLTRLMSTLLFGVGALDPFAFAIAPAILLPVATLACLVPAAAAARTDPASVFRR